jgi:hypothetical protein
MRPLLLHCLLILMLLPPSIGHSMSKATAHAPAKSSAIQHPEYTPPTLHSRVHRFLKLFEGWVGGACLFVGVPSPAPSSVCRAPETQVPGACGSCLLYTLMSLQR